MELSDLPFQLSDLSRKFLNLLFILDQETFRSSELTDLQHEIIVMFLFYPIILLISL